MYDLYNSKRQKSFLKEYEQYARHILKPTQDILKSIFSDWKQPEYWRRNDIHKRHPAPTPVQRVITRIKRPESVLDKIFRKPNSFPNGLSPDSITRMHDTLAGRVITYFISGFPMIDRELHSHPNLEIVDEDPPIAYIDPSLVNKLGMHHLSTKHKDSGYASIHYTVKVKTPSVPPENAPCVEIQVRTLAEDVWGEIEHLLGYKPDKRTSFAVRKQFKILSSQLASIDEHFNFLYEELQRYQEEVTIENTDPLNAENLPAVLAEVGAGCAQNEIDGLLKLLVSRGIQTVGDIQDVAKGNAVEIIRNTYRNHEGREPINFEVVACLAAIGKEREAKEIEAFVRSQVEYLKAWETLKNDVK